MPASPCHPSHPKGPVPSNSGTVTELTLLLRNLSSKVELPEVILTLLLPLGRSDLSLPLTGELSWASAVSGERRAAQSFCSLSSVFHS